MGFRTKQQIASNESLKLVLGLAKPTLPMPYVSNYNMFPVLTRKKAESSPCILQWMCVLGLRFGRPIEYRITTWLHPYLSNHLVLLVCEMFHAHGPVWFCYNILQRISGSDTPSCPLKMQHISYSCLMLGEFIAACRSASARESVFLTPSHNVLFLLPLNSEETRPHALAAVFHQLSNNRDFRRSSLLTG